MKKIVKFLAGAMLLSSVFTFTGCKDNGSEAPKVKDNFATTRWIPDAEVTALTKAKEHFDRGVIDFALKGNTFTIGNSNGTYKVVSDYIAKLTLNGETKEFVIDENNPEKASYDGKTYTKGSNPEYETLIMPVGDVYYISTNDRGYVVNGQVESGIVRVGDDIQFVGLNKVINAKVTGIEMFQKALDKAEPGDNVGICVGPDFEEGDLERGMVMTNPGALRNYTTFTADIHMTTKDEGGRNNPIFSGYRPSFYFNKADIVGVMTFENEMIMPGEDATVTVTLINGMAIRVNQEFSIREGGRTTGTGVIKAIIQ
ncbi:MAG: hypothetical protein IKX23_09455 [Treponema sp.]|nr:hypothetical protein [Treponema sp.]